MEPSSSSSLAMDIRDSDIGSRLSAGRQAVSFRISERVRNLVERTTVRMCGGPSFYALAAHSARAGPGPSLDRMLEGPDSTGCCFKF